MNLQTLKDVNLKDKTVILRVDYNVPIKDGNVVDDTRIQNSLPTINHLLKEGSKIIILSHLGRPKGEVKPELSLAPVADHLSKLLDKPIIKVDSCIGDDVENAVKSLVTGDILMLENTRFHKEEKENDKGFAKTLAGYGDIFVSDAFGTVHRAHASTVGIAAYLPSYAGMLVEKEITALTPLLKDPEKPVVMVLGGSKIDTKIGVIKNFIKTADYILIGGGLANTFLCAQGYDVGSSLCEKDKVQLAREIMLDAEKTGCKLIIPEDVLVADEVEENIPTIDTHVAGVEAQMKILDLGKETILKYMKIFDEAKTIIWNGPVGYFEISIFGRGTFAIAEDLSKSKAKTYLGGGDTIAALKKFNIDPKKFTHVSTGGGAMLEFLEGKELPGLKVLEK